MSSEEESKINDIHYSKNYLEKVFIRIDFENPLEKLKTEIDSRLSNTLRNIYPSIEKNDKSDFVMKDIQGKRKDLDLDKWTEWKYINRQNEKTLILTYKFLSIVYDKYDNFEYFCDEFIQVLTALYANYDNVRCRRLGLRYINNININDENEVFNWKNYIQPKLLHSFDIDMAGGKFSRIINFIEAYYENFQIRMQYGMPNADYPAPIKTKNFMIDIDAYSDYYQDLEDIKKSIIIYHNKIQILFENSIKDELRERIK